MGVLLVEHDFVGTGTLDSFAQGLLVVCTGRLTRLAGNITAFDKTYKAVIKFGEETDTLEYTGKVIKTAEKPSLEALKAAMPQFTGNIMPQGTGQAQRGPFPGGALCHLFGSHPLRRGAGQ